MATVLDATPFNFVAIVLCISIGAGLMGSLLGLGGGLILIPVLTLVLKVDIRYAVGASIVSVIATSSGAAAAYVRDGLANMRVAMFLELATVAGAVTGAMLAGVVSGRALYFLFGAVMAYSALAMLRKLREDGRPREEPPPDALADRLALHGSYYDVSTGGEVAYRVHRPLVGLGLMYVAGTVSGLLGIGSGALKVPAMDLAMGLPIKVSTATSNFMIGVTAAASAGIYFARGDIDPFIAGPVCVGVTLGAFAGSRYLTKLKSGSLRRLFVAVLLWVSYEMLSKGIHG
ncbi:sulfite exporter TauE/SafE family protein [Corallococcus exiguus]|uniref:sulfite exporter TauE/SafE family protein n=1 Tax=Corallococcus TaxID=83461 RepID=UPI000EA116B3|nr:MULTISPECIES: sulfite exporter TauE/SafE family protein [Corallococcus]NNC18460.1 sulfite exporter TauE/SafE family protein [Corallococcus exiguus]NRD52726.1 sulfite exporter TauE/SafE family protein [Corallococcus exiguus]NRD62250.1 sulfite exporter TauE/SafE family protein [Corallococcus exiguus]RKH27567.1 sulfite exporter TauE/SafE family protein [Corallococcus sp. CA041A]RKI18619.1 sulfite exporter TauE/SafE family protein [Corallococcus sp. AB030]